jgi:hypothetical protein
VPTARCSGMTDHPPDLEPEIDLLLEVVDELRDARERGDALETRRIRDRMLDHAEWMLEKMLVLGKVRGVSADRIYAASFRGKARLWALGYDIDPHGTIDRIRALFPPTPDHPGARWAKTSARENARRAARER